MWEAWVWSLGQEYPLEKGMATHSSTLAWEIPWTEEPGGLQSMGSQRIRHGWACMHACHQIPEQQTLKMSIWSKTWAIWKTIIVKRNLKRHDDETYAEWDILELKKDITLYPTEGSFSMDYLEFSCTAHLSLLSWLFICLFTHSLSQ